MNIHPGIEIVDLALFMPQHKILILADLHIGYEEALNKQGILVPRFQFQDTVQRLEKILKKTKPKTIIINGDLKHEFGSISKQEWRETLKVLDLFLEYGKVILIKGNHDTILGPIAEKKDVEIKEYHQVNSLLICHGDAIIPTKAKTLIIGHEHPAVSLQEFARAETYKCFLKGTWKRKTLIVMPSFNTLTEGTDLLKESILSPYLEQDLHNFAVFVVGDSVYPFKRLADLR